MDFLKVAKPTMFLGVPRIWEKIYDKLQETLKDSGFLKKLIFEWAMKKGIDGTLAEYQNKKLPFGFGLAKSLVFEKVRKGMGLEHCKYMFYGAAPLSATIKKFFMQLNMYIIPVYGMSESGGIVTLGYPDKYLKYDDKFFN